MKSVQPRFSFVAVLPLYCALLFSSCQVGRYFVYNFADVRDHKKFQSRPLPAAESVLHFAEAAVPQAPKAVELNGVETPFGKYLENDYTLAFLIIRNDTILYENYPGKGDQRRIVPSFSMAKSVTSMLIGCAIADGYIGDVNDPVSKYLPEMRDPGFAHITIAHLLQMTSGIDFKESYVNPLGDAAAFYYGRRLRSKTRKIKVAREPGAMWEYTSGSTQLLGAVLDAALPPGESVTDYLRRKLWNHLGAETDASWSIDKKRDGMEKTFCCINATARDFARLGRLAAGYGQWNGVQLVPEDWMRQSTRVDTSEGSVWYYQYQWWLPTKNGDFMARGILGQYIYANPAHNLVIVRLGSKDNGAWRALFPALAEGYRLDKGTEGPEAK